MTLWQRILNFFGTKLGQTIVKIITALLAPFVEKQTEKGAKTTPVTKAVGDVLLPVVEEAIKNLENLPPPPPVK